MLRRYFLIVAMLGFAILGKAQSYSYDEVLKKAEKSLKHILPEHLLPFAKLYYTPYYSSEGGEQQYFLLEKGKNTEGKLVRVMLRYHLKMKYSACTAYDSIETVIEMELDNHLKLLNAKGLDVVPEFVIKNLPCNLLTRKQALALVKKRNIEAQEADFQIEYDPFEKRFQYYLTGDVIKAANNPEASTVESMIIDAATGEILEDTFK